MRLQVVEQSPQMEMSYEMDVPWEVRGDSIFVAVTQGESQQGQGYGIKVTWSTGEEMWTDTVPWESLQGLLHFKVD